MRNAEATKERILEAAMTEFAMYGIAGGRVDRIAKEAGCNKNLIYIYFENKETLFATVLQNNLSRVYLELTFTPDDLPAYALQVFDFAMANPALMRLMAWFGLEQAVGSPTERRAVTDEKIAALVQAQDEGRIGKAFPPTFLLTTVMTLATSWTAANPFGLSFDPKANEHRDAIRKSVADVVRLIVQVDARHLRTSDS